MSAFAGYQHVVAFVYMKFQIFFLFHPDGNSSNVSDCNTTKSAGELMLRYKAISSANNEMELDGEIWVTISLIKTVNNKGPKTEPWGTPDTTFLTVDSSPPTATTCDQSDK